MSVELDNRPAHAYDDEMGWYKNSRDPETDKLEGDFAAPSATDDDLPEGHPSRKKSLDNDELSSAEDKAADEDEPETDDAESGFYAGKKKPKGNFRLNRKQGGIAAFLSAAVISVVMLGVTQGPSLIIAHMKELLLDRVSSVQMFHQRRYRQSKLTKFKNMFSKDGRLGQSMITEMEGRGYTFHFDPTDKNKIVGLTPPGSKVSLIGEGVGQHLDDYLEKKHPFRTARWKTKRMEAFYKKFGVSRASVVDAVNLASSSEKGDPGRVLNEEMAGQVVDDEPRTLTSDTLPSDANDTEASKAAKEAQNRINEAADASSGETGGIIEEVKQELDKGENVDGTPVAAAVDDIENAGPEAINAAKDLARGSLGGRAMDAAKGFFSPTNILDKVCTLKNRLRQAQMAGRALKALKLLRYAGVFINAADSTRTGKGDAKLINQLMKRIMSNDKTGNPLAASPGFGYLLKGKFSKNRNDQTKNKVAVDGQLGGTFGGIKRATDTVPGLGECWLWQNPAFQIASGAVTLVVDVVSCLVGCEGAAATAAAEETLQVTVTQAVKQIVIDEVKSMFTKQALRDLAIGAVEGLVADLSIEAIMSLIQLYAEKTMRLPFTGQESGAQLGDILTAGTGVMNKQRSLQAGMVPATTAQYAQAQTEYIAWRNDQHSRQSFATRVFDTNNADSLAFQGMTGALAISTGGIDQNVSNFTQLATSLFSGNIFSAFGNLLSGKSSATSGDEVSVDTFKLDRGPHNGTELAVDFAGNPQVILRDDIAEIDPESNIQDLINSGDIDPVTYEPISSAFKKHIEDCV